MTNPAMICQGLEAMARNRLALSTVPELSRRKKVSDEIFR